MSITLNSEVAYFHQLLTDETFDFSIYEAYLGMQFYKSLYMAFAPSYHRPFPVGFRMNHSVLHRPFELGYDIVRKEVDGVERFLMAGTAACALADEVQACYRTAALIIQKTTWFRIHVTPDRPMSKPDIFAALKDYGYSVFRAKFDVTNFANYSQPYVSVSDIQDFVYSTQHWCICMNKWLHVFAIHEEALPARKTSEDQEDAKSSHSSSSNSSFVVLPSEPDTSTTDQLYAPPSSTVSSPISPRTHDITEWLGKIEASSPIPLPSGNSTPEPKVIRSPTVIFNWEDWVAHGGKLLNTVAANIPIRSAASSPAPSCLNASALFPDQNSTPPSYHSDPGHVSESDVTDTKLECLKNLWDLYTPGDFNTFDFFEYVRNYHDDLYPYLLEHFDTLWDYTSYKDL
ncbi:hypothetical protein RhiJN_24395 [Ceratobasidium sp. AG-Ba]|nr:hypothetical protein RhiJN_24395 [Ceratobasidium sp. AG-Ba]